MASPGCHLCFWLTGSQSEVPMTPSLGLISLLEELAELRHLLNFYQLISQVALVVKKPKCQRRKRCSFWSLGWEDPLDLLNGNPFQYCLENPLGRRAQQATVHKVAKSHTRQNDLTCMHASAYYERMWLRASTKLPPCPGGFLYQNLHVFTTPEALWTWFSTWTWAMKSLATGDGFNLQPISSLWRPRVGLKVPILQAWGRLPWQPAPHRHYW